MRMRSELNSEMRNLMDNDSGGISILAAALFKTNIVSAVAGNAEAQRIELRNQEPDGQ
jgi:hypothetical protein